VREFLSRHEVSYQSLDVFADPSAKQEAARLHVEIVPTLVRGDRRITVLHTDQLRDFLGMPPGDEPPAYQDLVEALNAVLEGVERAVRQTSAAQLALPTPNRGRDLRELTYNIHHPINLMRNALDGAGFQWDTSNDVAPSRGFDTPGKLGSFCRETRTAWYARASRFEAERVERPVRTARGTVSQHQLLSAQAGHAAQHLRQIYVFLREQGIEPQHELGPDDIRPIVLGAEVF